MITSSSAKLSLLPASSLLFAGDRAIHSQPRLYVEIRKTF
jgi:hypothetical protein